MEISSSGKPEAIAETKDKDVQSDLIKQLEDMRKITEALVIWVPLSYRNQEFSLSKIFLEELVEKLSKFPENLISHENIQLLENWNFISQDQIPLEFLISRITREAQLFLRNLN